MKIFHCINIIYVKQYLRLMTKNDYKYLRECIEAIGSHTFLRGLYLSPVAKHIVPSFPPTQYKYPSLGTATPADDLREAMEGTDIHRPILGSKRSTEL